VEWTSGEVCALSALCALWVEVCALSALCALWVEVCALSALCALWVEVCALSALRVRFGGVGGAFRVWETGIATSQ
jgi:hypothetical protein